MSHYPTRYLARIVLVIGCRFCRELYHYPTRYLVRIVLVIGRLLVDYNFRHRLLYLHRYNLVIIGVPIISLVIVSLYKEYLFRPNPSRPVRDT